MNVSDRELEEALRQFGHASFRPDQKRIILNLLRGRDLLAVLATGSGKSLVYQLTSQLLPGVTVVVSPLIALMADQEESIEALGIEVSVVNSSRGKADIKADLEKVEQRQSKLLYVTPERFQNEQFVAWLIEREVSLLVVDEAHCISEWGHDFRPAYLQLGGVIERLGHPTILALTATATPWVRREITERLAMRNPLVVVRGSDRPNLFLEVIRVEDEADDRRVLHELFVPDADNEQDSNGLRSRLSQAMTGSGIIYTRTTSAAEETAAWLTEWGIRADFYHGRRRQADREAAQAAFMEGRIQVICATNAFGMGIDKPDVRFVIHRDIPASLEAYYQEAGRAGRDGELARATLIYRPADLGSAAALNSTSKITLEDLQRAYDAIRDCPEASFKELQGQSGLSAGYLGAAVGALRRAGVVVHSGDTTRLLDGEHDLEQISLAAEESRVAYENSRVDMIRGYAEETACRRGFILNYFGEEFETGECDFCDNDVLAPEQGRVQVDPDASKKVVGLPFNLGDQVTHQEWGKGVVQRLEPDSMTVLFDSQGFKTLANELVLERGLLSPATIPEPGTV